MRLMHRLSCALVAIVFVASGAIAAPILPEGTSITGQPAGLLGFDANRNDYLTGGVSAVSDGNIEFLTEDFALALDFSSDGLLRLFDNLGTGDDAFNYSLRFSLSGLTGPLGRLSLLDASNLTGGTLSFNILDLNTFDLVMRDVKFAPGFTFADVGIAVDEPSPLVLLLLGMVAVLAAVACRTRSGVRP